MLIPGDIPSPSLHLLEPDAGFKAFEVSAGSEGHAAATHYHYHNNLNRNKELPSIPMHAPARPVLAVPVQPSSTVGPSQPSLMPRRQNQKQPENGVMRAFTATHTASPLLVAPTLPKIKHLNVTNIAKMLQSRPSSHDRAHSPRRLATPTRSELSLAESNNTEVLNISPMGSSESLTLKERQTPSATPTKSPRRGPPAPIRIPNGRIHAPAIVVERDPDLADLETRISTSIKAPRPPKKSIKRPKFREHPKMDQRTIPSVPIRQSTRSSTSTVTDVDGNVTEASNDEFRFSLGFLLQPDRGSVMTTRTGRADSATLPELSPFLASDSYIPPVPTLPASLRASGTSLRSEGSNATTPLANDSRKLKPMQIPLRRSASPIPGSSPLASAYSQLTANSRPYVAEAPQLPRPSRMSEGMTEYSPAFTAASPLESPERHSISILPESASSFVAGKESPATETLAKSPITSLSPKKRDVPVMDIHTPGTSSSYSTATPELSPTTKPKLSNKDSSTSSPESLDYMSHEASSGSIERINASSLQRGPPSFVSSRQEHRALPKSAVPMSAISPGASTASLEQYLEVISFGNKQNSAFSPDSDTEVKDLATLVKRNPGILKDEKPVNSTFAPNHLTTQSFTVSVHPVEARKLRFPPLDPVLTANISHPILRERRPSLPSPVNAPSPATHERRPSAPSPLTGGPILFTPSSHQPLHAALSTYSSSSFAGSSFKNTTKRPRVVDDIGVRNSNLSIRTDHIRTAPRQGLVPYTPFSQGSDMFTPATSILGDRSAKLKVTSTAAPASAMSTAVSIKLATRARTRPPSGPRKPRSSATSKSGSRIPSVPEIDANVTTGRPRAGTDAQLALSPPTPCFETQLVRFRGLTLDVAKWTFTQEELQEVSRRAICQSADPLAIRLLPATILDTDIPAELERLELQREELKANYKYQYKCRLAALNSLATLSPVTGGIQVSPILRLVDELKEIGVKCDQYSEELHQVSDQIAQLQALRDSHAASALAMALRKINASFIKVSAELTDAKKQASIANAEREEAWAMADGLERELNQVKHEHEQERARTKLMSPPLRKIRRNIPSAINTTEEVPRSASRVLAARRRSKVNLRPRQSVASPQPFSALFTNGSIQSSLYSSQASANFVPLLPPLNSAKTSRLPGTANSNLNSRLPDSARSQLHSRRSESFSGTPSSSSRALINAQNELLQILGVPVQGMTEQGFRRTRSFSDADIRASMIPISPPAVPNKQSSLLAFNQRESRITSFYGAYSSLSRHNTIGPGSRIQKKRQTRASQWDMEAIYDGILDDPDTLFAVIRPSL